MTTQLVFHVICVSDERPASTTENVATVLIEPVTLNVAVFRKGELSGALSVDVNLHVPSCHERVTSRNT